jgi:hypothetical protein
VWESLNEGLEADCYDDCKMDRIYQRKASGGGR